jgi:hypothetical protein
MRCFLPNCRLKRCSRCPIIEIGLLAAIKINAVTALIQCCSDELCVLFFTIKTESVMKKMIAICVLACTFSVANANINAKTNAFVQPFSQSYALTATYLWFTDIDLTNPTGSFCDIWYEIDRLHNTFPGYAFSHIGYSGLTEFEFGLALPWYFATIYSDMNR